MKVLSQNSSLADLGMDSMMAIEIQQTLEREFDIFLSTQEIRNLTFAKLTKMSDANVSDNVHDEKKHDTEKLDDLSSLIAVVKDEDFIPHTYSDLSTKKQKTTSEVFFIPGIDGCGTVFKHLAPRIIFSTTCLHYNANNIDATANIISQMTDNLINVRIYISNLCYVDGGSFLFKENEIRTF